MSASLEERIQRLYDDTTGGWVDVWGEHLHHGYYASEEPAKDHLQAQIDMVDALLDWAGGTANETVTRVLDAGCGVGGSARHLARRFGARVDGLTLSPVQKRIAEDLNETAGTQEQVRIQVADANHAPFEDASFDIVWSLESGEHMPDKKAFLTECLRVLRPGGRLILATWCHRPEGTPLTSRERQHLEKISAAYGRSLTWVPLTEYEAHLAELPVRDVRSDDWSNTVRPFWSAVIRSVFTPQGLRALVAGGWSMAKGAWGGLYMRSGIQSGLVRYVVLTAVKEGES